MKTKEKNVLVVLLSAVMSLSAAVQAATVSFHETAPTAGEFDIFNFVGAELDRDNVGTSTQDGAFNDATTYVAMDRGAMGQTFVTGGEEPVYLLIGVWLQHTGYTTDNTVSTWYAMPVGGQIGIRITDPSASGTDGFVLSSEDETTYTITGSEPNALPTGVTNNVTGTGTWVHIVLDEPVAVAANTEYGFDVVAVAGTGLFFETLGIKDTAEGGDPYADGTAYTSGLNGVAGGTLAIAPGDRVFVVELVGAPPASASIPYPANNATGVETDPLLSWNAGFESTQSKVYFGTSPGSLELKTTITHTEGVDRYSHPVTGLAYNEVYYWRVDEVTQSGPDVMGALWIFTTGTTKASNPNPYDKEICVSIDPDPNLSWKAGLDSTQSKVYFGTSPGSLTLETTITHTEGLDSYSYPVTGLDNDQDYYWRVDQVSQTGPDITGDLWQFKTIPVIPITDPTLVGWWKFDEGPGKAIDWSGLNQHGTVYGGATSVAGYDREAINFDGVDDYVDLPIGSTIASMDSATIGTWIDFSSTVVNQRMFDFGMDPNEEPPAVYMSLSPLDDAGPFFEITTAGGGAGVTVAGPSALPSGWHHLTVTIDADTVGLYLDGVLVGETSNVANLVPSVLGDTDSNWLGRSLFWDPPEPYFVGSLDDFRIYNYALTQEEIELVMRVDPLIAWNPSPANGSTPDIEHVLLLSWSPGESAAQHDVYFGTDAEAVEDANASDTTGIYRGRRDPNMYTPAEELQWGQTYYWRIDQYNTDETISTGRIWNFTVADFLRVDDFEDYNDTEPHTVWNTWRDGYADPDNGSQVGHDDEPYAEQTIIHGGAQSMPVYFNNSVGLSEITRTLTSGRDWTRKDVKALSLWFRGYPAVVGGFTEDPPGTYTMTAAGADIWGQADEFHFAYKELTGVGAIEARVLSVDNTDPWAKAGVMIRETLEPGSKFAAVYITPGSGCSFQARLDTDADATSDTDTDVATEEQMAITAPYWVRIERDLGGNFTCSYSSDGSDWQIMSWSPQSIQMGTNIYIGLAVTAHNADATCEAQFSNVTFSDSVSGEWMHQDIGIQSNDAEPMYVALANNTGAPAVVYHDDPNAVQIDDWTEWNLDLKDFEDQGVNLTDVNSISIGFGDRDDPQAGGAGIMYFDDIGLYRPRCVPEKLTLSEADLNSDCVVDLRDLEILTADWLLSDEIIETTAPSDAGLVGHWMLDGNANDSSGNGNHGTVNGLPQWIPAGQIGGALQLDGNNDYVDLPIGSLISSLTNGTFAVWVNWSGQGDPWQRVFDFGAGETVNMFLTPSIGGTGELRFAITIGGAGAESQLTAPEMLATGWHHVAVAIDGTSSNMELYLDGVVVASGSTATLPADLGETTQNWLGRSQYAADAYFGGSLDDLRIYNQVLSQAEVAYLADTTPDDGELYVPVPSSAEFYDAEPQGSKSVNFKDYAVLADQWLEEQVWPEQ